ncbi:MAG: SDR family NAD(P)-dependent oxidoreductase [Planctomycetota bacterium]|nr:SDR family NAD(P)-dependent oxidoreductase [Planctomycetota bacterium]
MSNPITIVTGAGSGIGRALAINLAARGHALTLVGRTESKLHETLTACGTCAGGTPIVITCDLANSAAAHAVIDRTIAERGGLDNLVNCAGVAPRAPIEATDDDLLEEVFFHNAFAPAFLIARAWPHFKERMAGCVVNVSTLGTSDPFTGFFAYAASKSALDSFTRSMHVEGSKLGIRAFCVNMGSIDTPMLRRNFPEEVLPKAMTLSPEVAAQVIVDCIEGQRDADRGNTIIVKK